MPGKQPFDIARECSRPDLTPIERLVLAECRAAAEAGLPAPSSERLREMIGASSFSTAPGILRRLEEKGYISRTIYQRGRVICIPETGECTLPPNDLTPHWRTCPHRVPAPTIQVVRQRDLQCASDIEREARRLNKSMLDFLADLAHRGWHDYLAEQGEAA